MCPLQIEMKIVLGTKKSVIMFKHLVPFICNLFIQPKILRQVLRLFSTWLFNYSFYLFILLFLHLSAYLILGELYMLNWKFTNQIEAFMVRNKKLFIS